jgi:hypothetical protein
MVVSVYSKNLNIFNAEQFKESVTEQSNNSIYFTIGRTEAWANDSQPLQANSSVTSLYEVYRNMIGAKKITGNDLYHCIPRINWTQGTIYDQYDHCTCSLILFNANTQFYIVTPNWDVYKCLSNNNGAPSQNVPIQKITTGIVTEVDGYTWKYMYSITPAEQLRFTTEQFIPVKTLLNDDGSLQWDVQDNAIEGALEHIDVVNGGSSYTDNTKLWISITGDGTGANAFPQTNTLTGQVSSIVIDIPGSGYTYADVQLYDDSTFGVGAELRAIISPPGGHGSDALHELGGSNIIINTRLRYDEDGKLPVTNDFRQIALIRDPIAYGTEIVKTNTALSQLTTLTLSGVGDDNFVEDEIVYQGLSVSNASFTGIVVEWTNTNTIKLSNITGTPESRTLIGDSSGATGTVVIPYTVPELEFNSGELLYIDNIKPVTRSSDQIEDFKIVLKF